MIIIWMVKCDEWTEFQITTFYPIKYDTLNIKQDENGQMDA